MVLKIGGSHQAVPSQSNAVTASILSINFKREYPLQILLAEDNAINEKLFVNILTKLGYQPVVARDGAQACEQALTGHFDIIFMDVQIPVLYGLEANRKIRSAAMAQPFIVAMTANAMREDREACLQVGMDDYMSKPLRIEE